MLGHKLVQQLQSEFDVWTTLRGNFNNFTDIGIFDRDRVFEKFDVLDAPEVERLLEEIKPDAVINAVGIIKQNPVSADVEATLTTNSIFPHRIAVLAEKRDFRFIHISTDCVYNGKTGFYKEDDLPNAYDLYGKSKNLGEVKGPNCLTLRTSIVGRELRECKSLVEWFLSQRGRQIRGFEKAFFSGFPTIVLSRIIRDIIKNFKHLQGLYHVSSEPISKLELLKKMKTAFDLDVEITPEGNYSIDRSLNSEKFRKETGFSPPSWDEMIRQMANDPSPYEKWRKTNS